MSEANYKPGLRIVVTLIAAAISQDVDCERRSQESDLSEVETL